MTRYAIGVDYGTLSARAVVVDTATGRVAGSAAMDYPHGVMDAALPDGTPLRPDWALQHPQDCLDCLAYIIPEALRRAGVTPAEVVGLGLDSTTCTVLPVDADDRPLCFRPEFAGVPHAWTMLWKHHAAEQYAERMTDLARARGETFLTHYGGKVSSEWLFPKLWQVLEEAPEVYAAADRFIDVVDWIVQLLTGTDGRSACIMGYKAFFDGSYPPHDYFAALDPRFADVAADKLRGPVLPVGSRAGVIDERGAAMTGLLPGTAVAVGMSDSVVGLAGAGLTEPGTLLMLMGTSCCHMLAYGEKIPVPGINGAVQGGAFPDQVAYEAGQCCMGDHFAWVAEHLCPPEYHAEAGDRGINLHQLLTEKAAALKPGESGLLALDWWNGNRSILTDFDLTGMMMGMTLTTRVEEIYRALVEATAFGAREIVDNYGAHGVEVRHLAACGGISRKNPFLMQLWADVLNRPIAVSATDEGSALGAAVYGAAAAGRAAGGWDTVAEAARAMGSGTDRVYAPDPGSAAVYEALYREYHALHDWFGRDGNDVMKRLKALKARALEDRA